MMRTSDSTEAEMVYVLRKHWCNQKDTLVHSRKQGYALQSHPKWFMPQNHILSTREAEQKVGNQAQMTS